MKYAAGFLALLTAMGAAAALAAQSSSIVNTKHNLSASGPGQIRAAGESQVCIFCHTPHHATGTYPLWNRNLLPTAYRPYTSTSLNAKPGQPTGSSKLCLSCHDGTIALGAVASRNTPISMAGGVTTMPPGKANLGTNLADDHPISFKYDRTLAGQNPKLKDPLALPEQLRLDANDELQCTTCHDPHNNSRGKFLVMDNSGSQLCKSCHNPGTTTIAQHQDCASCHQPHSAPSGPHLLKAAKISDTCTACHSGGTGTMHGPDVASSLTKFSKHETGLLADQPNHAPFETSCTSCHGPHTMKTGTAIAPDIRPNFGHVPGVNLSGAPVLVARYEYETCFRCHGENNAIQPKVARQIAQNNTRLEFAPSAVSNHPVAAPGKNPNVPSLKPGLTTGSLIYCSDCHASSDSKKAGGQAANGTHGSSFSPLLVARYDMTMGTSYSAQAYALCFRCHEETTVMSETNPFKYHKKHVQDYKAPCSTCHDAHGISGEQGSAANNAHLMNFDTRVTERSANGLFEYRTLGQGRGTCSLKCHTPNQTVDHQDKRYGF